MSGNWRFLRRGLFEGVRLALLGWPDPPKSFVPTVLGFVPWYKEIENAVTCGYTNFADNTHYVKLGKGSLISPGRKVAYAKDPHMRVSLYGPSWRL